MHPRVYWVNAPKIVGRLAIMARPRAGDWLDDEVAGWRAEGIDFVVGLLEADEVAELDLCREPSLCVANAMGFISFPIADRGVPSSLPATVALARQIAFEVSRGRAVAVHCRAGIGRSAVIAACAMVCLGLSADDAFAIIGRTRGLAVPDTEGQRQWVRLFETAYLSAT